MNALSRIAALALLMLPLAATAYPTKPVRLVIPFPPGGASDYVGRAVGQSLSELWKQNVVVDNRGGAGATIGTGLVAKSPTDGYTLLMGVNAGVVIAPSIYPDLSYDPRKDLAALASFALSPQLLVVTNGLPVKSVQDLVTLAKAKPEQLSFASSGNGALPHLGAAMFNMMTGIKAVHVPYKGSGPALPDLIAGRTQYMIDIIVSALPLVQSGKLRMLAVTTAKRYPTLPEVPTVAESGLPGYEAAQWYGLFAPAGVPSAVAKKIETDVGRLFDNKALRAGLAQRGAEMMYGNSAQFTAVVKQDIAKWAKVVKETGARAD
ncbi:MAG: tripartite tricarboxylate transporter substrate binding protein [Burkholderiales bacterium]|nr:tripartite tricarboxylate transporter substrate binding protein [Burkholderiales bacterium]MDP2398659.1 tripartite tricarboxylate transporter substrate binding protein [Burkholderiales bacterium]